MLKFIRDSKPGYGLNFGPDIHRVSVQILKSNLVLFRFKPNECLDVELRVEVRRGGEILQTAAITNSGDDSATLAYSLNLCVSLNRASYGQLTEGGPLPLPASHNVLQTSEQSTFGITNPDLHAQLEGDLEIGGARVDISSLGEKESRDAPLDAEFSHTVTIQPGGTEMLKASFRLSPLGASAALPLTPPPTPGNDAKVAHGNESGWNDEKSITTYTLRRNVDYILANCVVPVSEAVSCVITDHVALPLGWNRDNYWQIRLLFETYKNLDTLVYPHLRVEYAEQIQAATKGHLNWVFDYAERPFGFWHRSYLITGKPKDKSIFQLDQQCYPFLELCDYLDYFPEEVDFVRRHAESKTAKEVLAVLEKKKDPETGLWPTDETPGDDAVIYPYHFSSHVLLWRTMSRWRDLLARLRGPMDAEVQRLDTLVRELREQTLRSFIFEDPESRKRLIAYLTDGQGKSTFYHDANDVPTLFAEEWKFVDTQEEISTWENTMQFGLSPANVDGYCNEGPYRGLGSVHSPGSWVLGYFQELAYAARNSDSKALASTWSKVAAAMQWDGTFSEAVDPNTAECSSKAWFSWPGSMLGVLIIQLRLRGQEPSLFE
jgi:hypothetical protein